jgi:microcystin-dependent protein
MSQPFVGEIRIFAGTFAPLGWELCNGQVLPIDQFTNLYSLIGTTYGGDGQVTFQLPDLQGRVAVHQGPGFSLGQRAGVEQVTLQTAQLPQHTHTLSAANAATTTDPSNAVFAGGPSWFESATTPSLPMNSNMIASAGTNIAHENMVPFLGLTFIIATEGIYPSQS